MRAGKNPGSRFFGSIINVGVLKGDDFGAPTFFAKKRAWS